MTTTPTFDDLYPDNDAAGLWYKAHQPYVGEFDDDDVAFELALRRYAEGGS